MERILWLQFVQASSIISPRSDHNLIIIWPCPDHDLTMRQVSQPIQTYRRGRFQGRAVVSRRPKLQDKILRTTLHHVIIFGKHVDKELYKTDGKYGLENCYDNMEEKNSAKPNLLMCFQQYSYFERLIGQQPVWLVCWGSHQFYKTNR